MNVKYRGPGSWALGTWVLGPGSWVLGPGPWALGTWVLGPGSWVLGPGSWGPGSWVLGTWGPGDLKPGDQGTWGPGERVKKDTRPGRQERVYLRLKVT